MLQQTNNNLSHISEVYTTQLYQNEYVTHTHTLKLVDLVLARVLRGQFAVFLASHSMISTICFLDAK